MKQPLHTQFTVWVPADRGALPDVAPRSAIVSPTEGPYAGYRTIWFEGNIYSMQNLQTFVERCMSAAGRCAYRYPTAALTGVHTDRLVAVATYDLELGGLSQILDAAALAQWLDGEVLPSIGPAQPAYARY